MYLLCALCSDANCIYALAAAQLQMLSTFVRRFTTWFEATCKAVSALPDGERVLLPRAAVAEMAPSIGLPPSLEKVGPIQAPAAFCPGNVCKGFVCGFALTWAAFGGAWAWT